MRSTGLITTLTLCIFCVASLSGQAIDTPNWRKLTESAQARAASTGTISQAKYWIFLDASAIDMSAAAISDRSLKRRAKVDGTNYLLDVIDYPIDERVIEEFSARGAEVLYASRWLRAVAVYASGATLGNLASIPAVERIDIARTMVGPSPRESRPIKEMPPSFKSAAFSYGISGYQTRFIRATKLHDAGFSGSGVMLAFFDSGFQTGHPAFDSANIVATRDFINGDIPVDEADCPSNSSTLQQTYHGTLTLGVVASNVPDTMVGVAPHADFILAKTEITCNGTEIKTEEYNWIAAAEWADSMGADIITSSLGYFTFQDSGSYTQAMLDGDSALITRAADIAASKNILVINSAGNDRSNFWGTINFPSDGDSVLAIGATFSDSSVTNFSSPGPSADGRIKPDVSTLGSGVQTVFHFGGYTSSSGTSLSAPLVAGGAALAFEADPTMTAGDYRNLIHQTSSLAQNPNNDLGYGLFNATAAANILAIIPIPDIALQVGESIVIPVSTSGRSSAAASIAAMNLPATAQFQDFGNGTAELSITGADLDLPEREVIITATAGAFVDSTTFTTQTYKPSGVSVYAAPNPFGLETNIYILPPENSSWRSITIFTPAGEPVWEKVNNSGQTADVIVKWDGRNLRGERVASGVYLVQVTTPQSETILKVLKTE